MTEFTKSLLFKDIKHFLPYFAAFILSGAIGVPLSFNHELYGLAVVITVMSALGCGVLIGLIWAWHMEDESFLSDRQSQLESD